MGSGKKNNKFTSKKCHIDDVKYVLKHAFLLSLLVPKLSNQ